VAEAVGLSPTSRWGSRKLVDAILAHINKTGIPKPPTDRGISDLLDDFLFVAGLTEIQGGNVVAKIKKGEDVTLEQYLEGKSIQAPDCIGFADDSAPECNRCEIYKWCAEDRIANLPPCFGLLFFATEIECKCCIEAPFCADKSIKKLGGS
jgi:hypothetical protein